MPPRPTAGLRLDTLRPGWLTAGLVKLGVLGLFVVLVGMLRPRMTTDRAWVLVGLGVGLAVIALAVLLGVTHHVRDRLPFQGATEGFVLLLRRIGLPLLGLAFFLAWTLVYVALWAVHPNEAFEGLSKEPRFADFFYYSVSTALITPPGDIFAHSRGARSATMIEMLTAFALLTAYLSSFVDWHRRDESSGSEHLG
jgi:hypothetical protein